MKLILLMFVIAVLSGCSTLKTVGGDEFAALVNNYCLNIPYEVRIENRAETAELLIPGTEVKIHCPGDPK